MRVCVAALLLWVACGDAGPEPAPGSEPALAPKVVAPVARVETADAWQDLVAQRPSAVVLEGGRVIIDLGRENARKHVALGYRDAWSLGRSVEGRQAGVVKGRTAALDFPLDGELAPALADEDGLAAAITVHPLVPKQSMTVLLDEQPLAHLRLGEGWQRRTLTLPPDKIRAGDNRLRLHFRRGAAGGGSAAVARVEVGSHAAITQLPGVDDRSPYRVEPGQAGRATLLLAGGGGLAYYVLAPRRGKLVIDARGRGAIRVVASTTADHAAGRVPTVLLEEPLRQTGRRSELDLTAWGGTPLRLAIEVTGSQAGDGATIGTAKIVARRSVPVDRRPRGRRDVIVVAIEGARADAFAVGRRPALKHLEALLAQSLVFERAYAPSPAAVPTHAAWLTSVAPPIHLTVSGTFVADGQTTLPEALSRAGYFRALATADEYVNAARGLTQGFDQQRILKGGGTDDDTAGAVIAAGLELLGTRRESWFLLAAVDDPQAPYEPPRELLADLTPRQPLPHLTHIWVGRVRMGKHEPDKKEIEYVRRLYRGELQVVDEAVGDLVQRLREAGRLDDAVLVVLGAHGEEFVEHASAGHGRALWEESIRVPLAIRAPAQLAAGRVSVPVDLIDLAPTIADLCGVELPQEWQGESLVPVIDDPQPPPRLVVAYLGDGSRAGIVGTYKLILGPGRGERFYDLGADPGETTDAIADGGVGLRVVRSALAWQLGHLERWRRARWGTGADLKPAFALDLGM